MRYLIFIFLLSSCASTGNNSCDRYQAIEDCQADRNDFFDRDKLSSENNNYEYCEQIVPQCSQ